MDISGVFKKINNVNSLQSTNQVSNKDNVQKNADGTLKLNENQAQIKGEIVNVTNSTVKIRVGDQIITGNMNLTGKLNIGEEREFLLEFEKGRLKLTLVPETVENLKEQQLENVLKELGQLSKDNMKYAKLLLENNLPVNKETLMAFKRSMALFGHEDKAAMEKSLLMLKNDIGANLKNTANVNSILDREQNITKNLKNIDSLLSQLGDDEVATQLKELFADGAETLENMKNAEGQLNGKNQNSVQQQTKNFDNVGDLLKTLSEAMGDEETANIQNQNSENLGDDALVKENATKQSQQKEVLEKEGVLKDLNQNVKEGTQESKADNLKDLLKNAFSNSEAKGEIEKGLSGKTLETLQKDTDKTETLKNLLKGDGIEEETLAKEITKSFGVDKEIKTPKDLEKHINDNLEKLEKARDIIKNAPKDSEVLQQLEKEITQLKDKMTFANEMKNQVFVQIPFSINNKSTNGELIVFKDKRNKGKKNGQSSALISLDTANLGIFEAYLVKKEANVDIQFRFVNDFVKSLVQNNAETLNTMLKEKNINISSLTYKKIDEAFSVMENEPTIKEDEIVESKNPFKFDVRG